MKRLFLATLLVVPFTVSFAPASASAQSEVAHPHVSGELLVGFDKAVPMSVRREIHQKRGSDVLRRFEDIGVDLVRVPAGLAVAAARAAYAESKAVRFAEPNFLRSAESVTPNDPGFSNQWPLRNTGQTVNSTDTGTADADIDASHSAAADAWDVTTGTTNPIIAVIDTGVDIFHPDIAANVWTNSGEVPGNSIDDDGNGYVDDRNGWDFGNRNSSVYDPSETCGSALNDDHGTHVAGTAGAVGNNGIGVSGVNWTVRLMPLKFLRKIGGQCGTGTDADAIEAILYATKMGAGFINASWGDAPPNEAMRQALISAGQAGVLMATAAGNDGANLSLSTHYPASFDLDNQVIVAASNNDDGLPSFSNFGGPTDLAAPGVNVYSTLPQSNYGFFSGTSMSAPHVAGALALLRAQYPHAPAMELKDRLLTTTDAKPAFTAPKTQTGGRLNVNSALRQARSVIPTLLSPNGGQSFAAGSPSTITWATNIPAGNPSSSYRVEFTSNARAASTLSFDFQGGIPGSFTTPSDSDAPWASAATAPRPGGSGSLSAKSGSIGHEQASWMATTRKFTTPATISFWYRVSSENCESSQSPVCGDYLRFYVDGVPQLSRAGEVGWTQGFFDVPEGTHTLSWAYQKDPSIVAGSDAAWIDDLLIGGADAAIWTAVGTTSSGATSIGWTVPSSSSSWAKVRVCQNTGGSCSSDSSDESDTTFSIGGLVSAWENLGGSLHSAPDVASWDSNRLDVFAKGSDSALWHAWWDGARWNGWESLGGVLTSDPTAVSWGPNRIDVFARGTDNALWHKWYDGNAWSGWESLGGVITSGPDASSWSGGRLDIFARGTDNGLWHLWFEGGWGHWEPLGGGLSSDSGAVSWGPNRIDVFARGSDNALWHRWWDGAGWGGWESFGGALTSGPDPASWASGRLDVFGRDSTGQLLHIWWDGSSWSHFETLGAPSSSAGGGLATDPSAVAWGFNRIDVFANGWDGALRHRWWSGSAWF